VQPIQQSENCSKKAPRFASRGSFTQRVPSSSKRIEVETGGASAAVEGAEAALSFGNIAVDYWRRRSRHRPSRPSKWRLSSTRWRPTTRWRTRSASIATCLPFPATMMTWKLRGHLRHFPLLGRPSVNVVDVRLIHTAFAQATIRRS